VRRGCGLVSLWGGNMKHINLSLKLDTHFGTGVNSDLGCVLLQLGDGLDQVRVRLTPQEVDRLVGDLLGRKLEICGFDGEGVPVGAV
jgi:hypothetical protein